MSSSRDEQGCFIILERTEFYPQGGGQPSDRGTLEVSGAKIAIQKVKSIEEKIRHYTDQDCSEWVGQIGKFELDPQTRFLHSKLHTSGHLIGHLVEQKFPQWRAMKGHHFPKECYVEFSSHNGLSSSPSVELLNQNILEVIESRAEIQTQNDQPIRMVRIGEFPFAACGGTHVKNTQELQGLFVSKIKVKNNSLKIYYGVSLDGT